MTATEVVHTPAEAAALLSLKEHTVRDLIRAGVLKARRMGGTPENPRKLRVTAEAVAEYLRSLPAYDPAAARKS